ncbi:hypothetical protein T10_5234 [Trichinella papuae]|uniref:Uncharacterized protein n=1 Tax=Trichinella papuae TaxID=268474 RepID=A0A0V1MDC8_9BILA|nr:hypothetical protein T10_5234 [Trichinella papuae]
MGRTYVAVLTRQTDRQTDRQTTAPMVEKKSNSIIVQHATAADAAVAAQERITSVPTVNSDWPTEQPAVSQLTRRDDIDVASRRTQLTLGANFVVQVLLLPTDRPPKTKNHKRKREKKKRI